MKLFGLLIFCVAAATALPLNEEVGEEHIPEPYKRVGEELIPEPYKRTGEEQIPEPYKRTGEEQIPEPYKRAGEEQIPEPYKRTGEELIPEPYKRTGEELIPEPYKRTGEEQIPEPYKRTGEELIPEPYKRTGEELIPEPYKRTGEEQIPEPYKRTGEELIPEPYKRTGEELIPEPYKRTGEELIPEPYKRTGEELIPEPYKMTGEELIPEPYKRTGEEQIPEPYKRTGEELIPEPYKRTGEELIPEPYKRTGEEQIPEPYKRTGEELIPEPYKRTGEELIPEPYKRTGEELIPEPYKRTGEELIPEPYKRTGEEQIPEPYEEEGYEQNWQLVPDGDGRLHLVNTDPFNLGTQDEPAPLFNADADTIFLLFTRNNRNSGHRITPGNAGTLGPHWNGGRQTRFIIHGWNNNGGSEVNVAIRNAYLDRADINVIVVDWGGGAQNPNYVTSRNHITAVGAAVARFIDFLNQSGGLAFNNVYVTGHSLGGHTAGIVGKRVTRGRLNTVVALDPALPLFSINDPANRVASGDANYVEVIHTNGGLLGFDLPLGQADFYPNGGRSQPGCGVDLAGTCAHSRAHQFFAESVRPAQSGFNSIRCANYDQILNNNCVSSGANARMGGEPSNIGRGVNGVYFLTTNGQSPFARG